MNKNRIILFCLAAVLGFIVAGCATYSDVVPSQYIPNMVAGPGESIIEVHRNPTFFGSAITAVMLFNEGGPYAQTFSLAKGQKHNFVVPNGEYTIQGGSKDGRAGKLTFSVDSEFVIIDTWPVPGFWTARFPVAVKDGSRIKLD